MAFVEAPALLLRDPHQIHHVERDPQSADGAPQNRGVRDVEDITAFFEEPARFRRFFASAIGEVDVRPAGEPVLLVPGALAVTEQNEFVHGHAVRLTAHRYVRILLRRTTASRPANFAAEPSASSIRSSWLYLHTRSVRLADPVLI